MHGRALTENVIAPSALASEEPRGEGVESIERLIARAISQALTGGRVSRREIDAGGTQRHGRPRIGWSCRHDLDEIGAFEKRKMRGAWRRRTAGSCRG